MTDTALTLVIPNAMTREEARACADEIKKRTRQLRELVYDFFSREGWRALGYASFEACAESEFDRSYQHLYRLVTATQIQDELNLNSPTGEPIILPETHARVLKSLPTPETRYDAYQTAQQLATAEGEKKASQRHIDKAVRVTAAKLRVSQYPLLSHLVNSGDMSVEDADTIGAQLERFKPATRGYLFQTIAKADGLSDPRLVKFIGEHYERADDKVAQLVIQTLDASGCLGGVPLRAANMSNALRELDEARKEVESDQHHTDDDYEPVQLTLRRRHQGMSWDALKSMMGDTWIDMMRPMFLQG